MRVGRPKWCPPSEPWESTVDTICRHPFASGLNGESSEPGVLDEIPVGPRLGTDLYENVPAAVARVYDAEGIRRAPLTGRDLLFPIGEP